jgi:stage V sporulation protein B
MWSEGVGQEMRQSFFKGTLVLLIAGVISRLFGFVPRVLLPRWIGAEGLGLFQMGYPAMLMLMTLLSGGLPVAVAKLVAESGGRGERSIVRLAMTMTLLAGGVLVLVVMGATPWLVPMLFPDERVRPVFLLLPPIVFVIGVSSIYRGYFQGKHNMMPTAVSQIVESIVRSVATLALAMYFAPRGVAYAAAGAMAGVLCGEVAGLLLLMGWPTRTTRDAATDAAKASIATAAVAPHALDRRRDIARALLRLTFPVTGSRLIGAFSHWAESLLIVRALAVAGTTVGIATAQYGLLAGIVIPTLLMPGAITFSLGVSLVPALAEAAAVGNRAAIQHRMAQSIRVSLMTGAPFAVLLFTLADPICRYIYASADAAPLLRIMAVSALFIYIQTPLQSALQALDRPVDAMLNSLAGAIVKLTLIYVGITMLGLGITGAALALNIYIVLVTCLHWRSVARRTGMRIPYADLGVFLIGMGGMAVVCTWIYGGHLASEPMRFGVAVVAGFLVFMLAMLVTGRLRLSMVRTLWRRAR